MRESSAALIAQAYSTLDRRDDREAIEALIKGALDGSMPLSRPLHRGEPAKLNPTHISMILMRSMGLRQGEIARIFRYTDARVSIILRHPYSRTLLAALMSQASERATDVRAQLEAAAPEMLRKAIQVVETSQDEKIILRGAFGILDRAGYGRTETHKVKGEVEHKFVVSESAAKLMAEALRESREIRDVSYVMVDEAGRPAEGSRAVGETGESVAPPTSLLQSPPEAPSLPLVNDVPNSAGPSAGPSAELPAAPPPTTIADKLAELRSRRGRSASQLED